LRRASQSCAVTFFVRKQQVKLICPAFINIAPTFAHKCLVCRADEPGRSWPARRALRATSGAMARTSGKGGYFHEDWPIGQFPESKNS
jgi:hypothetical protein